MPHAPPLSVPRHVALLCDAGELQRARLSAGDGDVGRVDEDLARFVWRAIDAASRTEPPLHHYATVLGGRLCGGDDADDRQQHGDTACAFLAWDGALVVAVLRLGHRELYVIEQCRQYATQAAAAAASAFAPAAAPWYDWVDHRRLPLACTSLTYSGYSMLRGGVAADAAAAISAAREATTAAAAMATDAAADDDSRAAANADVDDNDAAAICVEGDDDVDGARASRSKNGRRRKRRRRVPMFARIDLASAPVHSLLQTLAAKPRLDVTPLRATVIEHGVTTSIEQVRGTQFLFHAINGERPCSAQRHWWTERIARRGCALTTAPRDACAFLAEVSAAFGGGGSSSVDVSAEEGAIASDDDDSVRDVTPSPVATAATLTPLFDVGQHGSEGVFGVLRQAADGNAAVYTTAYQPLVLLGVALVWHGTRNPSLADIVSRSELVAWTDGADVVRGADDAAAATGQRDDDASNDGTLLPPPYASLVVAYRPTAFVACARVVALARYSIAAVPKVVRDWTEKLSRTPHVGGVATFEVDDVPLSDDGGGKTPSPPPPPLARA